MRLLQTTDSLWLISVTTLSILQSAESQTLTPHNLALGKLTPGSYGSAVRFGSRQAVVDGNRNASLNYTHCTGCFGTQRNSFGWWSVNLGQPYFVMSVHIYVPINPNYGAAIMKEAATKTLVSNGSAIIDVHAQNYSDYLQIGYKPPTDSSTLTVQAVSPVRYAQYVALVNPDGGKSSGLILAEVEVYGFNASQFMSRELRVTSVTVSSVSLSWKSPSDETLNITYEYGCGIGRLSWTELTTAQTNITRQVGNLAANTRYLCSAQVKNNPTAIQPIEATTHCATPPTTEYLSFGSPDRVDNDGRKRWRYNVTWMVDSGYSSSCLHRRNPYKLRVDGLDIGSHQSNSYTYYADGNSPVSISVWVRNRHGVLSQNPAVRSITTAQGLDPQLAPRNIVLISPSYDCVQLSWDPLQYPNAGPQTTVRYQYKCTTISSWQFVPGDNRSCGYSGYQEVSCQLRVRNRYSGVDLYSNVTTSDTIRTQCHRPTAPRAPKVTYFGLLNHDHQEQSWYRLSWQAPTASNWESFRRQNRYGIYYNGTWQWTFNNLPQFDIYLDSDRGIEFTIRAYNNENLPSLVVDVSMSLVQLQALRSCPDPPTVDNADLVGPTEAREPGSQLLYQCRGVVTHASGMYTCQNIGGTLEWTGDLVCHRKAISRLIITLVVPLTAVIIILGLVLLFTSWRKRSENANRPSGSGIQRDTSVDDFNNPEYDRIELQHNIPDPEYANVADMQKSRSQIGCYEIALNSSRLNKQVYETVDRSPEDNHIYNVAG